MSDHVLAASRTARIRATLRPERLRATLRVHWLFVAILAVGVLLRLGLMVALRQPLMTFTDANVYVQAANEGLFRPLDGRTAGYPLFLRLTHGIVDTPSFPVVIQHLLALGSCVLLYLIGLATRVPRTLAALGAGAWAISVDWLWLEHQLLTETLGLALLVGALAVFALARPGRFRPIPVAIGIGIAGAVLGMASGMVRPALFAALPGIGLAALLLPRLDLRARIVGTITLVVVSGLLLGGYVKLQEDQTGFRGIVGTSLNLGKYAGAAPFADCHRFRVPPGTASLCQRTPASKRPSPDWYYWAPHSPARELIARRPGLVGAIRLWGQRASSAQSGDVWDGHADTFLRLFGIGGRRFPDGDQGVDSVSLRGADTHPAEVTVKQIKAYYGPSRAPNPRAAAPWGVLVAIQPWTRPTGPMLLIGLLVTLAGALLGRGLARRAAVAIGVTAWLPVLYSLWTASQFNWRYAVVSVPLMAVALAAAIAALLARRRGSADGEPAGPPQSDVDPTPTGPDARGDDAAPAGTLASDPPA